jgi:type I restriction enzyme S subunit
VIKAQHREFKHIDSWWLDKLPVEWNYASLRWLTKIYAGGTPDKKVERYWNDGTIPWLNSGSVNQGAIETPSAYITQEAFENSSAKWIPAKSLVIALAGQGKTKGIVAQLKHRMTCNQSMAAIVGTQKVINRFVYWWLTSNYENIRNLAGGESRDGLNLEMIGSIFCPLPPNKEQQKISQFLDYETAKIDALIDEQKRLIELLKEKRQAVISHAVTKGLNPDAPMKDSGVEWLGQVPEHWEVVPLKHKCAFKGGGTPSKENLEFWNGDIPWVSPKDMKSFEISSSIDKITESGLRNSSTSLVPPGSMLLVTRSGILQRTIPVAINSIAVSLNQDLKALTFKNQHQAYFCTYLFMGLEKLLLLELRKQGATVESLEQEYIENCSIAWPPLEELKSICRFIESQLNKIGNLTKQSTMLMDKLQERRFALISAAVTGKIDVRDWQPPAGSDTVNSNTSVQTERHYG